MSKARVITALASAMALLLAGCDSEAAKDERMNSMFSELMKRPDILTAESRYQALLTQIQERLNTELGLEPWDPAREPACVGELSKLSADGEIRRYSRGSSPTSISDADWPKAVELVSEIANQQGFGAPQTVVERPGDHEVAIYDKYGAELIFGTAKNTILGLSTGCHLTREAHERGAPAPEEPLY